MFRLPFFNASKDKAQTQPRLKPSSNAVSGSSAHSLATVEDAIPAPERMELEHLETESIHNSNGMDFQDLNWDELTLVAKEDIYYNQDGHPVLLMKAGQGLNIQQVAKIIKFGVLPEQFSLSEDASSQLPQEIFDSVTTEMYTNGSDAMEGIPTKPLFFQKGAKDKILILDTDDRCIKRISDCLKGYGIPLVNVHPVTNSSHLFWAVERYEPQVLFIDFAPYMQDKSLLAGLHDTFMSLKSYPFIREVVLTAFLRPDQEEVRQDLQNLAKYYGAKVLFKPVNRFALSDVLTLPGQRK